MELSKLCCWDVRFMILEETEETITSAVWAGDRHLKKITVVLHRPAATIISMDLTTLERSQESLCVHTQHSERSLQSLKRLRLLLLGSNSKCVPLNALLCGHSLWQMGNNNITISLKRSKHKTWAVLWGLWTPVMSASSALNLQSAVRVRFITDFYFKAKARR